MPDSPSNLDLAGIVGGAVTLLGSIGAGLRWAWRQAARERAAREERIDAREDGYMERLEKRLALLEQMVDAQAKALRNHALAIGILVAKVAREDPAAPELKHVAQILGSAFPVDLDTPEDLLGQLDRLK